MELPLKPITGLHPLIITRAPSLNPHWGFTLDPHWGFTPQPSMGLHPKTLTEASPLNFHWGLMSAKKITS